MTVFNYFVADHFTIYLMAICMFYTFLSFVPYPTRYLSFSLICKRSWNMTVYDNEGIRLGRMLVRLSHVVHTHTISCTSIRTKPPAGQKHFILDLHGIHISHDANLTSYHLTTHNIHSESSALSCLSSHIFCGLKEGAASQKRTLAHK